MPNFQWSEVIPVLESQVREYEARQRAKQIRNEVEVDKERIAMQEMLDELCKLSGVVPKPLSIQERTSIDPISSRNTNVVRNPKLSAKGFDQCKYLHARFPHHRNINFVLCSPLMRAQETAFFGFTPLWRRVLKAAIWMELIESGGGLYNDLGAWTDGIEYVTKLPKNTALMTPLEGYKSRLSVQNGMPREASVAAALYELGEALKSKDGVWKGLPVGQDNRNNKCNVEILVITHNNFLAQLLDLDHNFMNPEFRSYQFRPYSVDADGTIKRKLVETTESKYVISTVRPYGYLGEDRALFPSETDS
ncbi:hypothetical protein BP5796_10696 [Coleophoma crateriformis]|uniref:Uncharacterized protein n=1 Tax=Coleophoma crateriformis TaxID=565419 RepID=A0A3D8QRR6_9HELO|nr:hypothetical protein BP5796_10696 [Coleophoma crateriformis]